MGFQISKFLPSVARREITVDEREGPFSLQWRRRGNPQTGGQNYSLSSYNVNLDTTSGPLNIISRPFMPLEPAPAVDARQIPTNGFGGTSVPNGQIFSQPLLNPDVGGFTRALTPSFALPFDTIGAIMPAGRA